MIGILGSDGCLGKNLCRVLQDNDIEYVGGNRKCNLHDSEWVNASNCNSICNWIKCNGVSTIINLAANCGGIGLNKKSPFKLWLDNTIISTSVLEAASIFKTKVVMIGTVCSYAENCKVPFNESYLMEYGFPEPTNRAYGISKLNSLVGSQALRKETGIETVNLIPVNMYGPHDDFNLDSSHVIPALIRKMVEAKNNNYEKVSIWGTGNACREFLYVDDCCEAIIKSIYKNTDKIINIGTGNEISIFDLALMIKHKIGYEGILDWDNTKPDGQLRRCLDTSLAWSELGWKYKTNLDDGISRTIEWYLESIK